jgi:hypothetical protein|tara:strand:- start:24170 stop:24373 length:204 start_codon:yes stop_codon:yes gene_type:complete
MNIFVVLNLRTEFESISYNFNPSFTSDIDSLRAFKKEGYKKNRFRKDYDRAVEIAEAILGETNGAKA